MELNKIYQGDTLEVLKTFPDDSIDCIITSPPYWGLRDYGTGKWVGGDSNCDHKSPRNKNRTKPDDKSSTNAGSNPIVWNECGKCGARREDLQVGLEPSLSEYLSKLLLITAELKRVLKKGGTMWWNHGDCYSAKRWSGDGKGQTMNGFRDGHRDINPEKNSGLQDKTLVMQNFKLVNDMVYQQGWLFRNIIIWHKPNVMPSSVKDRFTIDFEPVFFFVKSIGDGIVAKKLGRSYVGIELNPDYIKMAERRMKKIQGQIL